LKDLNDVWLSGDGGWSWHECASTSGWVDREWVMTVIDHFGYLYIMGGNDYDSEEALNDVWRTSVSFHDLPALSDVCSLPALPRSCSGYGLKCLPPSVKGGNSTVIHWSNSGYSVSCDACLASSTGSTSSTNNPAAIAAAVIFSVLFAGCLIYLYWIYQRAKNSGGIGIFGLSNSLLNQNTDQTTSSIPLVNPTQTSDSSAEIATSYRPL